MHAGLPWTASRVFLRTPYGVYGGFLRGFVGRLKLLRLVGHVDRRVGFATKTNSDLHLSGEKWGLFKRISEWRGNGKIPGGLLGGIKKVGDEKSNVDKGETEEETVKLRRLFGIAASERKLMGIALSAQLISSAATMSFPMALGKIVDSIQATTGGGVNDFEQLIMILGGIFTVSAAAVATRVAALEIAGSRISRKLRKDLFKSMLKQETAFFDTRQSGELVNRLSADASSVSRTLTENIATLLRSGIISMASLGCVVYLSPSLSLVALSLFPPIFLCATISNTFLRKFSRRLLDALASATQVASERLASIRTVRLHGAEQYEYDRYSAAIDKTYGTSVRLSLAQAASSSLFFYSAQLALLAVLFSGGRLVTEGSLTVGALTSFCMYAVNMGVSSSSAATAVSRLARAQGAAARMMHVLDRSPTDVSSTILSGVSQFSIARTAAEDENLEAMRYVIDVLPEQRDDRPAIEFKNVHFSYPTRQNSMVLNGLDLSIYPGEIVAVCGNSGCGKSTLMNVLLRMYSYRGSVTLSGVPIELLPLSLLRRAIAVVPQEPTLFDGTIGENIAYAQNSADHHAIERVARDVDAHSTIMQLPLGYSTRVGERGVNLSGGERGRVSIARALLRQPRVLLLDESTAAMDAESEARVAEAVAKVTKRDRLAILAIAHRVSILRRADRVAVMKEGRIQEIGQFDELVGKTGSLLGNIVRVAESSGEKHEVGEKLAYEQ